MRPTLIAGLILIIVGVIALAYRPTRCSIIAATETIGLVIEARRKIVSGVIGALLLRHPYI